MSAEQTQVEQGMVPAEPGDVIRHGEAEDGTDEAGELGAVQIHNNVIASIARLAALKVPGVAEMSGNFVDGLAGMIGKRPADHGIRVDLVESAVVLEMHVVMDFGVRIPHVAWQIQNEVRQAVEQMTGKTVKAVNVVVQGLRFPGGNPASVEGGTI